MPAGSTVASGSLVAPGGAQGIPGLTSSLPIVFVFQSTPLVGAMINVPITINLAIPANLAGSAYYNATDPGTPAVFTLTVQPAGTVIGTINKPTSGGATFSGSGATISAGAGSTLRMTATTVDSTIADIGITILANRQ